MQEKNICKFVSPSVSGSLRTNNFIFEANREIMETESVLIRNRLFLVVSGKNTFNFDKITFKAEMGCLVMGFKNELFFSNPSEDAKYMYIDFEGERSLDIFTRFGIDSENRLFSGFKSIIPYWENCLYNANEITMDLVTESILLYTFSNLVFQAKRQESVIGKMLKFTKEHFVNSNLSINILAEELSYNPKYLSHAFKKELGITYSEYLKTIRLKYAISLFENGIDSVKNVAMLSGFSDPLYFSTVFTKNMRMSPSEYKAKITSNR